MSSGVLRTLIDLFQLFEVFCAVLAERADEIFRQRVAFVDVSADFADPAGFLFFDLWLWLRFDVFEVVCVGYGRILVEDCTFRDFSHKESVSAVVVGFDNLCGKESVGAFSYISKAVGTACVISFVTVELVHIPAALETKALENVEGCFLGKDGHVEEACGHNHIVSVVCLVYSDVDSLRSVSELCSSIDDAAVVLAACLGSEDEKTIGKFLQ